jgi:hypothetical protein
VALYSLEFGFAVQSSHISPDDDCRFENIVWKHDEENAVFWNLEDERPFFTIRLLPSDEERFGPNIIGPIHFTPDGKELIY